METTRPALARILDSLDPEGSPRIVLIRRAQGILGPGGRLGAFSASFNPLTRAHAQLIELARGRFGLDEVVLILAKVNVDKGIFGLPLDARLWLLARYAEGRPYLSVGAASHGRFVDKVRCLRAAYPPATEIAFIVGYDTLVRIFDPRYYRDPAAEIRLLFADARFIAANRGAQGTEALRAFLDRPDVAPFAGRIDPLELDPVHAAISSTLVRDRLASGRDVADLVPPELLPLLPSVIPTP